MIHGADSAVPKPRDGFTIWGVYVAGDTFHVWTHEEVRAQKVEAVLPIVVPPQKEKWWELNAGYAVLEQLVRDAVEWGIPEGSPLCLDIEEGQAAQIPSTPDVSRAWAIACNVHKLIPWCYSPRKFLDPYCNRWLAEWPDVRPENPQVPEGFRGWQYAGNVDGIDLDVFRANEIFLSPELKVVKVEENRVVDAALLSSTGSGAGATDADAVSDRTEPPAPAPVTKEGHEIPVENHDDAVQSGALDVVGGSVADNTSSPTKEGNVAKTNVSLPSLTQIEIGVTKLAAIAGAVEGSTDLGGLPSWLRITLLSVSGAVIAVNHWLNRTTPPSA